MPTALAPLTAGRPAPEVLAAAAAAAGFDRVGLTLWLPGGELDPRCADPVARRDLRRHLDATGTGVLDVGVVVLRPGLDLAAVDRLAGTAAELGAGHLLVANWDEDTHRAADTLGAVTGRAAAAGLRAVLEFMPYSATRSLAEAAALGAAAGAGTVLDVLHLVRSGGTAADLGGPAAAGIGLVQLCDARPAPPPPERLREEALSDRLYPGDGELPLAALLAALPAGVPVTVEAPVARDAGRPPVERARAAMAALRRLPAGTAGVRPGR